MRWCCERMGCKLRDFRFQMHGMLGKAGVCYVARVMFGGSCHVSQAHKL